MKIQVSSPCRTVRGTPCGHSPRHTWHHTEDRVLSHGLGECDKHLRVHSDFVTRGVDVDVIPSRDGRVLGIEQQTQRQRNRL